MADGFETMVEDALRFFTELEQNNTKAWFEPRKAHYKEAIAGPAGFFADLLAEDLGRLTGKAYSPKVFRIYRDVRFSKDKTPLNAHLHLMWSPVDGGALAPSWFWGLAPSYFIMGLGVMSLNGAALTHYRVYVDKQGDGLRAALDQAAETVGAEISDWGPVPLKKVPKPYAADHPHGDLLRRKALAVTAPIDADWRRDGVLKATLGRVEGLMPVWRHVDAQA